MGVSLKHRVARGNDGFRVVARIKKDG